MGHGIGDLDSGLTNNNNHLLEHVGLPHVLDLAVHVVNLFGWMSQGGHSEQILFFALFYQSTPSCLKVRGGKLECAGQHVELPLVLDLAVHLVILFG